MACWRHQAITWTNFNVLWVRFPAIHLRAILQWVPTPLFCMLSLKILLLTLLPHLPGDYEVDTYSIKHDLHVDYPVYLLVHVIALASCGHSKMGLFLLLLYSFVVSAANSVLKSFQYTVCRTHQWKVPRYFTMIFHICATRFHDSMGMI